MEPGHLRGTMYPQLLYWGQRNRGGAQVSSSVAPPFTGSGIQPLPTCGWVPRCAIEGLTRASGCS